MRQVLRPLGHQHLQMFAVFLHLEDGLKSEGMIDGRGRQHVTKVVLEGLFTRLIIMSTGLTLTGLIR